MRVAALSMSGINFKDINGYRDDLVLLIKKSTADLAVLPAYSSLLLGISTGGLSAAGGLKDLIAGTLSSGAGWNEKFLQLHSSVARDLHIYLAAGTLFENDSGHYFHTAYCFDPKGNVCCKQRQTHLTRAERNSGLCRGEKIEIFSMAGLKAGLIVGNDARHPEVGRILGLRGADLVLHSGAIETGLICWSQVAGIWAQVQQNQFWAVEAQLSGYLTDRSYGALSAVIGPCEITPGKSGYLAQGYSKTALVSAELNEHNRLKLKEEYPLLELLNTEAFADLYN